jgi:hypothetical protein
MSYEFSDTPKTARRARALARKLLERSEDLVRSQPVLRVADERNSDIFITLIGWWRFATQTAKAYLVLDDAGFGPEKAPLMRNLIGHVSAMAWLLDNKSAGIDAMRTYSYEMQKKLVDEVRAQGWEIKDQIMELDQVTFDFDESEEKFHAKLVGELGNYSNMLSSYGSSALYPVYRTLSSLSHTTVQSAMAYITDTGGSASVSLTIDEGTDAAVIWLAVCLIQAGNIVTSLIAGHPMRALLGKAANDLGVTDIALPPTRKVKVASQAD